MRILAFAGKKQSGKNTCSNFLHGYQLRAQGVIDDFSILSDGNLVIKTDALQLDGKVVKTEAQIDVTREDVDFASWASANCWPFVKGYSFASSLKDICMGLLGLKYEQCYGTDAQKNTLTPLLWENMPGVITPILFALLNNRLKKKLKVEDDNYLKERDAICSELGLICHEPGQMTGREVMQYVGTEIFRRMHDPVWVDRTINQIKSEGSTIAIITDCRFKNECEAVKKAGGKIIHLLRGASADGHASENDLESYTEFDAVIDNKEMNIHDNCTAVLDVLTKWGWVASEPLPQVRSRITKIKG